MELELLAVDGDELFNYETECLIHFVTQEKLNREDSPGDKNNWWVRSALKSPVLSKDFLAKKDDTQLLYAPVESPTKRAIIVGLEKQDEVTVQDLRVATHKGIQALIANKLTVGSIALPTLKSIAPETVASIVTEIAILSEHKFDELISEKAGNRIEKLTILGHKSTFEVEKTSFEFGRITAQSTVGARRMGNMRANICNPGWMEERAQEIAKKNDLKLTVVQFEELLEKGMNLIASVGQAAPSKPRLIILEYNGDKDTEEQTALVGKGITHDSGGLNLKVGVGIELMHLDMCGSAVALNSIDAIAQLKLKKNVIAVLCCADNAVDSEAYKPGAIIKSYKGLTVEIGNTDAEGRLVLADGLNYVAKHYPNVKTILDFATLTGSMVIALGEHIAGVWTNSDELSEKLVKAGSDTFERVWRMPLLEDYRKQMKGQHSDLNNVAGRSGGCCTAAAFLSYFIEEGINWAHFDIAGAGMFSEPRLWQPKGATGFGVRLVVEYIKNDC